MAKSLQELLDYLGNEKPKKNQIELAEKVLFNTVIEHRLVLDNQLTKREKSALFWAARGLTTEETAKMMKVKKSTVEAHRKEIRRKLKCKTLAQAVFQGIKYGYLAPTIAKD